MYFLLRTSTGADVIAKSVAKPNEVGKLGEWVLRIKRRPRGKSLGENRCSNRIIPLKRLPRASTESSWINRRREFVNKSAIKIAKKSKRKNFSLPDYCLPFLLFPTIVIPSIVLVDFNKPKSLTFSHHVGHVEIWQNFLLNILLRFSLPLPSRAQNREKKRLTVVMATATRYRPKSSTSSRSTYR